MATPAKGNVHKNFGFSTPLIFELRAHTERTDGRTCKTRVELSGADWDSDPPPDRE